jgi:hypothetical protein
LEGADAKQILDDRVEICSFVEDGRTWYRINQDIGPLGKPTARAISVWNPNVAYNLSSYRIETIPEGKPVLTMSWKWKQVDDVYVPAESQLRRYNPTADSLTYSRDVVMEDCILNSPIDPEQFSYKGLGLKDGDVIYDRISKVINIYRNGNCEKLANYNERFSPEPAPAATRTDRLVTFPMRRIMLLGTGIVLFALSILTWRKWTRSAIQ